MAHKMNALDKNDMDPTQGLFVAMAVLDSKMQTLQTKIAYAKKDNQNYEKIIADEKTCIEKMEEKVKELSTRECKIIANIDNLRQTKTFLQEMETNMKHQLVMNTEKNEEHKISQRNLLMKYNSIANEYHEIYCSLPWAKERKILHNDITKKRIEIKRLKQDYSDYVRKLNLFESISNQRVQVAIVAFVKLLVERQHEQELKKKNSAYEKQIQEEIAQLGQRKKALSEQISTKAKDAIAEIRERAFNPQKKFIHTKVALGNKPGSALSIKERLGLINLTFHKPLVNNPILQSSNTNNVQPVLNTAQVIPSSAGQIQDQPTVCLSNVPHQPTTAVTDETEHQSNSTATCENAEEPSSSAMLEEVKKDLIINKESQALPDEIIQAKPANTVTKEITEIESPTNDVIVMKKDHTATGKQKQIKKGIKRFNNLINKSEIKEFKKIRRVSFKTTVTSKLSNLEKSASKDNSRVSQLQTIMAEDNQSDKNTKSQEQNAPSILTENQSPEDIAQNSSQETDAQSISFPNNAASPEFNIGFDSRNYNIGEDNSNQQGSCTPQISSYFSSPAFSGQGHTQPFDQTPNNSTTGADTMKSIYNFPMSPAINLSPPFLKTHTSEGNKTLESFFGGSSSGGEKKSNNFFQLF